MSSTPLPTTFEVEVSGSGASSIAAWVFAPQQVEASDPSLWTVCFPGATYRGLSYYDKQLPGCTPDTYSMARYLAARGIGLIVIDNLGTGESRVPISGWRLDRFLLADVYQELVAQMRERLACGMLSPDLAPLDESPLFLAGIGHSMGGMLLSHLQAHHAPFDAICLLGWATLTMLTHLPGTAPDLFERLPGYVTSDGYIPSSLRPLIRQWFCSPAVSEKLIAADEREATVAPAAWMAEMKPQALFDEAARITCPLFLGFGDIDTTATPHQEVAAYPHGSQVTLFIQRGAHHCANFESGRFALWQAIADFLRAQAVQATLRQTFDEAATQPLAL